MAKLSDIKVNGSKNAAKQEAARKLIEAHSEDNNSIGDKVKQSVLKDADAAVNGERMENYGKQLENFTNIADRWSITLREKLIAPITPQEVAMMQIDLKLARLTKTGGWHRDSIVDIAGYAECLDKVNQDS